MIKLVNLLKEIILNEETTREKLLKKDLEISQIDDLQNKAFSSLGKKYGWNKNELNKFLTKYNLEIGRAHV